MRTMNLKIGEKYSWCMGAEPSECEYLGSEHTPKIAFNFKVGNATHKLSIKDVNEYIKSIEFLNE